MDTFLHYLLIRDKIKAVRPLQKPLDRASGKPSYLHSTVNDPKYMENQMEKTSGTGFTQRF